MNNLSNDTIVGECVERQLMELSLVVLKDIECSKIDHVTVNMFVDTWSLYSILKDKVNDKDYESCVSVILQIEQSLARFQYLMFRCENLTMLRDLCCEYYAYFSKKRWMKADETNLFVASVASNSTLEKIAISWPTFIITIVQLFLSLFISFVVYSYRKFFADILVKIFGNIDGRRPVENLATAGIGESLLVQLRTLCEELAVELFKAMSMRVTFSDLEDYEWLQLVRVASKNILRFKMFIGEVDISCMIATMETVRKNVLDIGRFNVWTCSTMIALVAGLDSLLKLIKSEEDEDLIVLEGADEPPRKKTKTQATGSVDLISLAACLLVFVDYWTVCWNFAVEFGEGCMFCVLPHAMDLFTVGGRTIRKLKPLILDSDIEVVDRSRLANIGRVNQLYHSKRTVLSAHGFTRIREEIFDFPVYCDKKTFARWYDEYYVRCSSSIKRRIRAGDFREEDKIAMRVLFSSVIDDMYHLLVPIGGGPRVHGAIAFVLSWVFVTYFEASNLGYGCISILAAITVWLQLKPDDLLYVFLEEIINSYFGVTTIIAFETSTRFAQHPLMWIWPAMLHILCSFMPFPLAVFFHLCWNRVAVKYSEYLAASVVPPLFDDSEALIELTGQVFAAIDIIIKMKNRDSIGLLLSMGMQGKRVKDLISLFTDNIDDIDFRELAKELSPEEEGTVLLSADYEGRYSFIFSWIPIEIRKSPTFSKMTAFAVMLAGSSYFSTLQSFRQISQFFTSEDFVDGGNYFTIASRAVVSFLKAVKRVWDTGDWSSFWDMPRDIYFRHATENLLYASAKKDSIEDVVRLVAEARDLISSRAYVMNGPEENKLLRELRAYVAGKAEFLRRNCPRKQPIAIWLNGVPGTGKTTIIKAILDYLCGIDGWKRFPGDVLSFDIYDKFPVSSGINVNAKAIVVNDAPAIYTEFPKMDLMPLDVFLQKVLDTYALYFRAAAVEDKGLILNDIAYLIITTNHLSFRCPGETEKIQRRIEDGILVDIGVRSKHGNVKFAEFSKWSQADRNDGWAFNILLPECNENFIKFTKSSRILNWFEFLEYTKKRVLAHNQSNSKLESKFQSVASTCACGVAHVLHISNRSADSILVSIGESEETYKAISEECVAPDFAIWFDPYPFDFSVSRELGSASIVSKSCWALPFLALFYSNPHVFYIVAIAFSLFINYEGVVSFMKMVFKKQFDELRNEMLTNFVKYDFFWRILEGHCFEAGSEFAWRMGVLRKIYLCKMYISKYKWHLATVGVLAGLVTAWYSSRRSKSDPEFDLYSKPIYARQVKPESMFVQGEFKEQNFPDAKLRGWVKRTQEMNTVKIGRLGVSGIDLQVIARRALAEVDLYLPSHGVAKVQVLKIAPEWLAFNKHWIFRNGAFLDNVFDISMGGIRHTFTTSELRSTDDVELFVLKHDFPVVSQSLHKFLPVEPIFMNVDIIHVSANEIVESVASPDTFIADRVYRSLQWKEQGEKGDCAEPVLAVVNGTCCLAGAVAYGKDGVTVGCTLLSQRWFDAAVASDPMPFIEEVELFGADFDQLNSLVANSEFRNVVSPFIVPIGTAPGGTNSFTSRLRQTRLYADVSKKLSQEFGKPSTLRVVLDDEYSSAMTNTFKNVNLSNDLTSEEIDVIVREMIDQMAPVDFVSEKQIRLSPMDVGSAIFGDSEINVARTDFKTSVGPILKAHGVRNKHDMFKLVEEATGDKEEVFEMIDFVRGLIKHYDDNIRENILFTVFGDFVAKDEVRPVEKLARAKIRLFCVLCAALNIYVRMYLMPVIQYLLNYPEKSECYGGINAGSVAWNDLAERMNIPNHRHFDMDFETFDTSHDSRIFRGAALFFSLLSLRLGYSLEQSFMVYKIVLCFKYQVIRWMKDYAFKFKGMPSGCIFTLSMNSFVNSFLLRVAYRRLIGDAMFLKKVRTANVGDDNINAVSMDISKRFNMVTISREYRKLGYVATPAKKGNAVQEFIPFKDLTFLKRTFDWSAETNTYLAPLDADSIYKSFCFEFKDAGVSPVQRLIDVAQGAQREMFLHGKNKFFEFQRYMSEIFIKHQMSWPGLDYDELMTEYMTNKFCTYL